MVAELERLKPGASERLARAGLTELQTWPELIVRRVAENQTGARCSVAGAYDSGPPARISVATSASTARQDFTALHELGHHLQKSSFDLMDAFEQQADGGLLLEDAACDAFAAEILLPAALVERHFSPTGPTAGGIVDLWQASGASRMAVCVRSVQHLIAPGHVLLLGADGRIAFAASHGLPPLRRGSFQGDIPIIDRARAAGGRSQGLTQVRYRDGILGRELYAQTAPMDGYLIAVLVTDLAPWRSLAPSTLDTGPEASEFICEHCGQEYSSFGPACLSCRIPKCPDCGRCGCAPRVVERQCPGCFALHPLTMFVDGAERCLDCS
jgi:hypothetical protein